MPTRRQFLIATAAVAGGVAIGYRLFLPERLRDIEWEPGQVGLTPYVVIDRDGITIIAPRAEMGQGIHTTLAALVAEELDVALDQVRVEHGPASEHYSNNVFYGPRPYPGRTHGRPTQATGGQTSVIDGFEKMRKAGAAARNVILQAAAVQTGADISTLTTSDGAVIDADGNAIPYVDLAPAAAQFEPPADPPLKSSSEWKILGKSQPRVDMVGKCTGTAQYALDVKLPGMRYATVKRSPRLGAKMIGYDASAASKAPGVERIIPFERGLIIVATNTWHAFRAADLVEFDWDSAPYPDTSAEHRELITQEFNDRPYHRPRDDGDVEAVFTDSEVIEAEYHVPYLAHATMEPLNATAWFKDGQLDIWLGNQFPTMAVHVAHKITGLPEEGIRVHTTYMGGAFGRRFEMDDLEAAVRAAMAMPGTPVRMTYTREEDMTHDMYRPMASGRFRAVLVDGKPTALDIDLAAPSLFESGNARLTERTGERDKGVPRTDISIIMGTFDQPYEIENFRVTAYRPEQLLPVGWWRGIGETQNTFYFETFMDELAHAAGLDPLEMRLSLIKHAPSRQVLESVAEMSGWGTPLPEGHARGLAYGLCSHQATAEVVEIIHSGKEIKILKAFAAVDVGVALDPRNIEGQVQGGLNWGLCSSINGEITVTDGAVDQTNFHTFRLLRASQAPSIEVRIHESGEAIKGVGEAGTPTAAPALGNAIFAATGKRIRELPFGKHFRFI